VPKVQRRKPPKRKQPVKVDDWLADKELAELALMIDEYKLDKNKEGWFTLPWRDGFNAASLAIAVWQRTVPQTPRPEINAFLYVIPLIQVRNRSRWTYERIDEVLSTSQHHTGFATIRVGLRCAQISIARSDGGGQVYNDLLKQLDETVLENEVIQHRCHDVTGVNPGLVGDVNDRLRRAFVIAWRRGLYHAAYALPQAKDL